MTLDIFRPHETEITIICNLSSHLVARYFFLLSFAELQTGVELSYVKSQALAFYGKVSLRKPCTQLTQRHSTGADSVQVARGLRVRV